MAINGRSDAAEETSHPPFPTGSHLQLVRTFYTTADGLLANRVRALAVTRNGTVLAACENGVSRLDGIRWVSEAGPVGVTALFAPTQGPDALAGATNGVWEFANNRWQQELDGPEGVIAFAAEPDGTPWALATNGVWRKAARWVRVHTIEDDLMFGPARSFADWARGCVDRFEDWALCIEGQTQVLAAFRNPSGRLAER